VKADPLVEVENLTKHYPITEGVLRREVGRVRAVDGISFDIRPGETVGIVGESGCGKSTAATSLLRLEEPTDGRVLFGGEDITTYDKSQLKAFRRRAQMIFQDPSSSFDPRMSIGDSVAEPLKIHGMRDRNRRRRIVEDLLERVGLSARDADRYPHEFSGGQKQRVALARALVVNPDFIVADEPVSALDVSIQAEILGLIDDIQAEFGLSILLISHDMGVVRQICDRVNVMYLGEIVESGPTEDVFDDPQHPYTKALMGSIPKPDPRRRGEGIELTGDVPNPSDPPTGCRFHTRCPSVIAPDDVSLGQEAWRNVLHFRSRTARGDLDPRSLAESHLPTEELPDDEDADLARDTVNQAVRAEFDLPSPLSDSEAERAVTDAVDALVEEGTAEAGELLREAFPTVCANRAPELVETDGRRVACHLHDESVEATPQEDVAFGIGDDD